MNNQLQEGAMSLVTKYIPATTPANREAGLRYAMKMLNAYGITSIQDAIVNREELETYTALDKRGELNLRVVAALWWNRERDEERISLETAIAAFTINAAFVNQHEGDTVSIEVGKFSDLIVLDRILLEIKPAEISGTKVLLTLLEGKVVHGNLGEY